MTEHIGKDYLESSEAFNFFENNAILSAYDEVADDPDSVKVVDALTCQLLDYPHIPIGLDEDILYQLTLDQLEQIHTRRIVELAQPNPEEAFQWGAETYYYAIESLAKLGLTPRLIGNITELQLTFPPHIHPSDELTVPLANVILAYKLRAEADLPLPHHL